MKKRNRLLALILSIAMTITLLPMSVFAAEYDSSVTTVEVAKGGSVTDALNQAFGKPSDTKWECQGTGNKSKCSSDGGNPWFSIETGGSHDWGKIIKTTCTHTAITSNEFGEKEYTIRVKDDVNNSQKVTIKVVDNRAEFTAVTDTKASIVYDEDGKGGYVINYDKTAAAIVKAVLGQDLSGAEVTQLSKVAITKNGEPVQDFESIAKRLNINLEKYVELKGESLSLFGYGIGYIGITENETFKIHITWPGDENYKPVDVYADVELLGRADSSITTDETVIISFQKNIKDEGAVDALKAEILKVAVKDTVPADMDLDELTVEYKTGTIITSFKPLDSDISTGAASNTIKLSWSGNAAYKACSQEFELVIDKRLPAYITLNDGVSVVYDEDVDTLEQTVLNAVIASKDPADLAPITIEYQATLELNKNNDLAAKINEALGNSDSTIIKLFKNTITPAVSKAINEALENTPAVWVPFEGIEKVTAADIELDLGALAKIPGAADAVNKVLEGISLGDSVKYPAIGVGVHTVRVSFAGNDDYIPASAQTQITIKKAPVILFVDSKTVSAADKIQPMVKAERSDNHNIVEPDSYTLYAGINSSAQLVFYLDLSDIAEDDDTYIAINAALLTIGIDLEKGVSLSDLTSGKINDLVNALGKLGINIDFDSLLKALATQLGQPDAADTLKKIFDAIDNTGLKTQLQPIIDALENGLSSAINTIGSDVIFTLGTPEGQPGVYAVGAYLDDVNYEAADKMKDHAAGYLVINADKITLDVISSATINCDDDIPDFVTNVEPKDAEIFKLYVGLDSDANAAVFVEGFGANSGVKNFGEFSDYLAENTDAILGKLGINGAIVKQLAANAAKLAKIETPIDELPVKFGTPVDYDCDGIYVVGILAVKDKCIPAAALSSLTINPHDWVKGIVIEPTCTGDGKIPYECSICNATKEVAIPALGHNSDGSVAHVDATCTESGVVGGTYCTRCDDGKAAAEAVIDALGHNYVTVPAVAPTCTETGLTEGSACDRCGDIKVAQDSVDALGHDIEKHEAKEAKCEEIGWDAYESCKRCDYTTYAVIPATGHDYDGGVVSTEAKCEDAGVTTYTCNNCGATYTEAIDATGHTVVTDAAIEATCLDDGKTEGYHCSVCKAVITAQQTIKALGHDVKNIARAEATCTKDGHTAGSYCDRCGEVFTKSETIPATGHAWDGGVVTTPATSTTDGVRTFTCGNCGDTYTESIPATGSSRRRRRTKNDDITNIEEIETPLGAIPCMRDETCPIWPFSDASTMAWYHDAVHYALETGMMKGVGNDKFAPNDTLTRAMICQILYNKEHSPEVTAENPFTDVAAEAWYSGAVIWAHEKGLVSGFGNGVFGPEIKITREQLAVILWNYAGAEKLEERADLSVFTDADQISDWAKEAFEWCVTKGIISGKGEGKLDPKGNATRAESAQMLFNYIVGK